MNYFYFSPRFLFWTDTGIQPKIERSLLDGSKRKVLVWSGILYPVSIAVDVHSSTIYFTDSARETVESCDLEGNARRILFYETNSVFYGIETFKVRSCLNIVFLRLTVIQIQLKINVRFFRGIKNIHNHSYRCICFAVI